MKEYWRNPESTAAALPAPGWFDTGDLGWRVPYGVEGSRMGNSFVISGARCALLWGTQSSWHVWHTTHHAGT
jgi:acyl-CoA synthetase (AMP-forming)/AMP-acid ligase II